MRKIVKIVISFMLLFAAYILKSGRGETNGRINLKESRI